MTQDTFKDDLTKLIRQLEGLYLSLDPYKANLVGQAIVYLQLLRDES